MNTSPTAAGSGRSEPTRRWRPGVRFMLVLVVLLPIASTGLLAGSRLGAASTFRRQANLVADDAARLQAVALARVKVNLLAVPLEAITYASNAGLSTTDLDAVLRPDRPYAEQLSQAASEIRAFPVFSSATLRRDVSQLEAVRTRVAAKTIRFAAVSAFMEKMQGDVDDVWDETFETLRAHISAWRSPGSFGVQASTLTQTYQAFRSGGRALQQAGLVLENITGPSTRSDLFEAHGVYLVSIDQFTGHLGNRAREVWAAMQADPTSREFAAVIKQARLLALDGGPSPYAGKPAEAGAAVAHGLVYVTALDGLVIAASQDLEDAALTRASAASSEFEREAILVVALAAVVIGGVVAASRVMIRPMRRLATNAQQVREGDFDLERLAETGPRETVAAIVAFNEMASTLKAVETRTLALAAEDFSHPDLKVPLPGRTGRALQVSIDSLIARIHERERQRVLLHEDATHDNATGLRNRAAVMSYLTNDVARRRHAGETVAVLFLDLDGLKQLNDTYGHEIGDIAIKTTADAILESTEVCDVVGRLGGDEFLIVLCHEHSGDGDRVISRINASLSERCLRVGDQRIPLRASVGIALARCDSDTDPLALVRSADAAMYVAKREARIVRDQVGIRHG